MSTVLVRCQVCDQLTYDPRVGVCSAAHRTPRSPRRFLTVSFTLLFALIAFMWLAGEAQSDSLTQEDIQISGAVIRLEPEGVSILDNTSHTPVGVAAAYINPVCGCLTVERDTTINNVITTSVTVDETLARLDIEIGLSGGGLVSNIYFYKDGQRLYVNNPAVYAELATSVTNIWFMVVSY